MERSDWNDDDYPLAPVPLHEREWRHPSEFGQAQWVRTEPPLTIGRGLLIATGAIGGLLSLAVLWAMLPGDTDAPVTALSTIVARPRTPESTASFARPSTTSLPATTTPITPASVTAPASSLATTGTVVVSTPPVPTMVVKQHSQVKKKPAVAVTVGTSSLVITTAGAVEKDQSVTLALPSGATTEAKVLMVDPTTGFAVLVPTATEAAPTFEVAKPVHEGDTLTVLSDAPSSVTARLDNNGQPTIGAWMNEDVAEGTPVVDADGHLVGLCSHEADGPHLLTVESLDGLQQRVDAATSQGWMGIQLAPGGLVVDTLDPKGPAAAAGVHAGDIIIAIDKVVVTTPEQVTAALTGRGAGDAVTLTLLRVDNSQLDVTVTLANAPAPATTTG